VGGEEFKKLQIEEKGRKKQQSKKGGGYAIPTQLSDEDEEKTGNVGSRTGKEKENKNAS